MATPPTTVDGTDQLLAALDIARARGTLQAVVATLDPDDLDLIEAALATRSAAGWRGDPAAMASHLTLGKFRLWRYVRLLSTKFREAADGTSIFQIWNVPARTGKSVLGSRWGPVWCFDRRPEARIILTSYGDRLADEHAVFVRDTLETHRDVLHAQLRKDRRRADLFVTEQGGALLSGGLSSGITGFGCGSGGGAIVDDPYKNWQDAHSATIRERVLTNFRTVVELRRDDAEAFVIVIQTRWMEDDLTGALLREQVEQHTQARWDLVRLPALAEAHDPQSPDPLLRVPDLLGRRPGEVIEPERFSLDAVRARAAALGSYLASGLEQQRPAPVEGGEVKRAWWKWTTTLPTRADAWASSWDMKLKDTEAGDYVVGQVWSRTGPTFWCHAQVRGQWSQRQTRIAIALLSVRFPQVSHHYVENTGYGPEVMRDLRQPDPTFTLDDDTAGLLGITASERAAVEQTVRRGLTGLLPVNVKGSKAVRLRAVSGIIEGGHVHLPESADWAVALVNESAAFPNAAHDDMVDTLSQALSKLREAGGSVSVPDLSGVQAPGPTVPVGILDVALPQSEAMPVRPTGFFRPGPRR